MTVNLNVVSCAPGCSGVLLLMMMFEKEGERQIQQQKSKLVWCLVSCPQPSFLHPLVHSILIDVNQILQITLWSDLRGNSENIHTHKSVDANIPWKTAASSEPCLFILLHQNYAVAFQFYYVIYSFKYPK